MPRVMSYLVMVMVSLALLLSVITPAFASKQGRKNTAWALTGVAAYQIIRGKTLTGLITGAGAYYAWDQVKKADKKRR